MSEFSSKMLRGIVKNGLVVLEGACNLPEGTRVMVRPAGSSTGTPASVLAALKAPPHVRGEDVEELMKRIEEGRRPVRFESSLD